MKLLYSESLFSFIAQATHCRFLELCVASVYKTKESDVSEPEQLSCRWENTKQLAERCQNLKLGFYSYKTPFFITHSNLNISILIIL